ncbi:MAG TPA: amidohydrolase family protein [Gammaproteobacteria bacterium]
MRNRRAFLKALGGVTAGMCLGGAAFSQGRKEVMIGGRRIKTVDIHYHAHIPAVMDVIRGTEFERNIGGSRNLSPERIAVMDARGIDVGVISANQYWWYAAPRRLARDVVRVQDEGFAEWCDRYSDRYVALTSVALQYPDLAADQLDYAVNELGLRGASIGGHVEGEVPSSERFDPFWAKAQELDVPVFMHPGGADNVVKEGGLDGRGDLGNIIGNPLETTVFLSHMIYDGTLDRFPHLKIVGSHGGGYLPSYLGRSEVACEVRNGADCLNEKRPSEYLWRQIFVDSMVFSDEALRHLVAEMGASQIVYGSDIPFNWPDTIDIIANASFLRDAEKAAILGGNLIDMLRIDPTI